jgi:CBS domain-containing protein
MLITTKATDYMTHPVVTIGQNDMLKTAIDMMIDRSISCLPVVDKLDQLVGILTESDILQRAASNVPAKPFHWLSFILRSGRAPRYISHYVQDVMTRSVISAPTNATPESIIDLMQANRIQQVPIVEQGQLVGLICRNAMLDKLADVAVSVEYLATDRSIARERWTRLNAMQMPIDLTLECRARSDASDLNSKINRSTERRQNQHQFL